MASAYLAFGGIGKEAVLTATDLRSAELNTGENYTFAGVNGNYLVVTATVEIYVAFTSNGTVPNPANTAARVRIPAGSYMAFSISNGVRIAVLAA